MKLKLYSADPAASMYPQTVYVPAESADIETIFSLAKEHIDTYEDIAAVDYSAVLCWYRRKITKYLHEYTKIIVYGETAGFFRLHKASGEAELDDLYLFPQFQGRGIGTALLQKICSEAEGPLFLYVFSRNERAQALYRRLGFQAAESISPTRFLMRYSTF